MTRRKTRNLSSELPGYGKDAMAALMRGPADERADVQRSVIAPMASELVRSEEFQEAYEFVKADTTLTPRRGVAMSQIEVGGASHPGLVLERPVGLTFAQLRAVVRANPMIGLIIKTRIRQVQRFLRAPKFEYQPGFTLRFRDDNRTVQDADRERFTWLRDYLMNCGAEFDPRRRRALQRDNLFEFVAKHLRDSLSLDAAPVEYINTRTGLLHGFKHVDGAKVFLTDPNVGLREDFDGPAEFNVLTGRTKFGDPGNIIAVYALDGRAVAQYTHMDMLYPVRNPSGEEERYGYGIAEPEELLRVSTAWLEAFTMNARSISDNSIPRGILSILGDYDERQIAALKGRWMAEMRGASNRHRLVTLFGEADQGAGVTFTPTGPQVEEQMYGRWTTLLNALTCSTYLIDPAEVAMESYTGEGASSLSGSDTEAKLTSSADKGLYTLLTWLGGSLNEVVQIVDPDVMVDWSGLDDTKEDAQAREQTTMTFGEVRKRHGQSNDDIAPEVLEAPSSVAGQAYMAVLQNKQQLDMMEKQAAMQPQPGQEGAGAAGGPAGQGAGPGTTPDDPEHPSGPGGENRFGDQEGGVWQAGDPADPGTVAKSHTAALLDVWPGE